MQNLATYDDIVKNIKEKFDNEYRDFISKDRTNIQKFADSIVVEENYSKKAKCSSPRSSYKISGLTKRQYRRSFWKEDPKITIFAPIALMKNMAIWSKKTKEYLN